MGVGCQNRLLRSPGFAAADQVLNLRARVKSASEVQELRIWRLLGHYVVAWVIRRDHGFFCVVSHDDKVLLSDY
jgi:hypothetical protein